MEGSKIEKKGVLLWTRSVLEIHARLHMKIIQILAANAYIFRW